MEKIPTQETRSIDICFREKFQFDTAMYMAFAREYAQDNPRTCIGYILENGGILLFEYIPKDKTGFIHFPYPFDVTHAIGFCWGFIKHNIPDYEEPDTDGSVAKGFQVTTFNTGWQNKINGSFIFIRPIWLVYGK